MLLKMCKGKKEDNTFLRKEKEEKLKQCFIMIPLNKKGTVFLVNCLNKFIKNRILKNI